MSAFRFWLSASRSPSNPQASACAAYAATRRACEKAWIQTSIPPSSRGAHAGATPRAHRGASPLPEDDIRRPTPYREGMRSPLRALSASAALASALVLTASAHAITVTASMDGGSPKVTWTQPDGYPNAFVDLVEVASKPDVDAEGFFLLDNVVGFTHFATPEGSTGSWAAALTLTPGATYYVHAEIYDQLEDRTSWSAAVPFTVPLPAGEEPSAPAGPSEPGTPVSPIVPVPGDPPPVVGPDYQARLRRSGSTLLLGFRDRAQPDETPPARYKVCWTRPVGVGCARRYVFDGRWDVVRLRVTRSVGRSQGGRRVVRITWRVGGHAVRSATLSVLPARRR